MCGRRRDAPDRSVRHPPRALPLNPLAHHGVFLLHSKSTTTTTVGPSEADKAAAAARNDLNKAVDEQKELLESLKKVQHISLDDVCLKCKEPMLVSF